MFLPRELVREILLRLPSLKSAVRLSCVCRLWHKLITNSDFGDKLSNKINNRCITLNDDPFMVFQRGESGDEWQIQTCYSHTFGHVNFHTFLDLKNGVQFNDIGSCNGILCFYASKHFHLYNPITREYRKLPPGNESWEGNICGFGFDSNNNDYKIISIHTTQQTEIYKLSTNRWSIMDVDLASFRDAYDIDLEFIYVNGCCYWMVLKYDVEPHATILTFDFRTETFDLITVLFEECSFSYINYYKLCILDNSVAVCRYRDLDNDYLVDIWAMSENGNKESLWIKRLSLRLDYRIGAYWIHDTLLFQIRKLDGKLNTSSSSTREGEEVFKVDCRGTKILKPSLAALGSGCYIPA